MSAGAKHVDAHAREQCVLAWKRWFGALFTGSPAERRHQSPGVAIVGQISQMEDRRRGYLQRACNSAGARPLSKPT